MDLNDYELQELGLRAKVFVEMHLSDPKGSPPAEMFELLIKEYEGMAFGKNG